MLIEPNRRYATIPTTGVVTKTTIQATREDGSLCGRKMAWTIRAPWSAKCKTTPAMIIHLGSIATSNLSGESGGHDRPF